MLCLQLFPRLYLHIKMKSFENIFERIIETFEDYEFNTVAIDISGLEKISVLNIHKIFKDF